MASLDEQPWNAELQQQLEDILKEFTPDRYPAVLETQRDYEMALGYLEIDHFKRLEDIDRAEQRQYAADMQARATEAEDQFSRSSDAYRNGLLALIESQADRRQETSREFLRAYVVLDRRFGFPARDYYQDTLISIELSSEPERQQVLTQAAQDPKRQALLDQINAHLASATLETNDRDRGDDRSM